ncbi:MAG: GAF domain-containing sensor histidine kinase [Sphingobacteriales bacterium]|nr:GAF domain-containing sensor histidine kinase [Sphingobacteriales bacterium]
MIQPPIPKNELERITDLSEFDLDYSDLEANFKDLTLLAAKVAGTPISLINLIDSFTQWTISAYGFDVDQMPREESVCQYTIMDDREFEVKNLASDDRFKDKSYVKDTPQLRFYLGVPLTTANGNHIGALCVLDYSTDKTLTPEKVELLKIIAAEIVNRLAALKIIEGLKYKLAEAKETQKRVAHDIRGPIGGIIGLAQMISAQGDDNQLDEVLEFINLIQKSGSSLLELADEILSENAQERRLQKDEYNLDLLKEKLEQLYLPQAVNKNISFEVNIQSESGKIPFSKNKILQIVGNLISNAMKFTPQDGKVRVSLDVLLENGKRYLKMIVEDNGTGITEEKIKEILSGQASSTSGTEGESGYGFGLTLVKHLVEGLKGTLQIQSQLGKGTSFTVQLPQK